MRPVLRYMIVLSAGTVLALGLLSGCSAQMTDKVDNDSIGNPDYETTYYSSAVIKIPVDPDDYIEYAPTMPATATATSMTGTSSIAATMIISFLLPAP